MNLEKQMIRPNIPRDWYEPNLFWFSIYLLYSMGMLVGFGYLSYYTAMSDIVIEVKIPCVLFLILLAGHGFHLLGWFAHDGIHLSLLKNKYASVLVGMFVGALATFPTIGYGITHWNHHRYTNQKSDPDTAIYSKYKTFWVRFFLSRVIANRGYFKNTFNIILDRPFDKGYRLPFTSTETRVLAIINIIFIAMWIAVYCIIAWFNIYYALLAIILPYLSSIPFTGLRIYVEHAGTKSGIFRDSRTYSSPLYTLLMFGNNFHLEHHLYPKVPAYHLGRVHKFLKEKGVFAKCDAYVDRRIIAPLTCATGKYQYPEALSDDGPADPFDINNRAGIEAS